MQTIWTAGLKEEKREEIKKLVESNKALLDREAEILKQLVEDLDNRLDSVDNFTTPAWSEQTAHLLGQRKAYKKIIEIITIDQAKRNK